MGLEVGSCQHDPFRSSTTLHIESNGSQSRIRCVICNQYVMISRNGVVQFVQPTQETKVNLPEIPPGSMPPEPWPDPTKLEYDEWVARTKECPACHGQGCEPHECDDGRLIQGPPCERCEGACRIPL